MWILSWVTVPIISRLNTLMSSPKTARIRPTALGSFQCGLRMCSQSSGFPAFLHSTQAPPLMKVLNTNLPSASRRSCILDAQPSSLSGVVMAVVAWYKLPARARIVFLKKSGSHQANSSMMSHSDWYPLVSMHPKIKKLSQSSNNRKSVCALSSLRHTHNTDE